MKEQGIKYRISDKILEKLVKLFRSWKIRESDWVLATEGALQREGYPIFDEKNPYEIDLLIAKEAVPWKQKKSGWTMLPPKDSQWLADFQRFIRIIGYSPHMVALPFISWTREMIDSGADYSLPSGIRIKLSSPENYVYQLIGLLTHPSTKSHFVTRIPSLISRFAKIHELAKEKKDKKTIVACEEFLELARHQKSKPAIQKALKFSGSVKGKGIGKGRVKGKVRVILHAKEFWKVKKGELLVTPDTNPEYMIILPKVKAVVTDNGGFTCHAAIIARELMIPAVVSREMRIPCILGISNARNIFKTGDRIEVDANKGVVRKIS
jgi:phosphohistidine swiveling domain-containing protein